MAPGGTIQNVEGHIAFLKAENSKITDAQQKPWGPVRRRPTDECKSAKCCLQRNDERNDERSG